MWSQIFGRLRAAAHLFPPVGGPGQEIAMKRTKPRSEAQVRASQENGRKSPGPKTDRGKSYSRRNALKHRLYAVELLVLNDEKPELEELQTQLKSQFPPITRMRGLAYEMIVALSWRLKLALRHDQRQLKIELGIEYSPTEKGSDAPADPYLVRWYGAGKLEMREAVKILDLAEAEHGNKGRLSDETKLKLTQAFGPSFVETLTNWPATDGEIPDMTRYLVTRSAAAYLVAHSKNFEMPFNPPPPKTEVDLGQVHAMRTKILKERRDSLLDIPKILEQWSADQSRNSGREFNPGFLSAAMRDLRKAVAWYVELEEMGL
jgi:hypothetical protein